MKKILLPPGWWQEGGIYINVELKLVQRAFITKKTLFSEKIIVLLIQTFHTRLRIKNGFIP